MPKQNKKGKGKDKGKKVERATAETDDDFDDMLAELRALDVAASAASSTTKTSTTSTASSSSSSSSSNRSTSSTSSISRQTVSAPTSRTGTEVTVAMIRQASFSGDVTQLRWWGRRGVRVSSAQLLCDLVGLGAVDVAQCLVEELGADVNRSEKLGFTPLCIAAQQGSL